MYQKIKSYYQNSPLRIALTWVLIHCIFLCAGMVVCWLKGGIASGLTWVVNDSAVVLKGGIIGGFLTLAPIVVWLFPLSVFLNVNIGNFPSMLVSVGIPIFYYGLFFIMLRSAKQTESQLFKVLLGIFGSYFVVNLVSSFYFLSTFLPTNPF